MYKNSTPICLANRFFFRGVSIFKKKTSFIVPQPMEIDFPFLLFHQTDSGYKIHLQFATRMRSCCLDDPIIFFNVRHLSIHENVITSVHFRSFQNSFFYFYYYLAFIFRLQDFINFRQYLFASFHHHSDVGEHRTVEDCFSFYYEWANVT